jgi:hypothetical protein
MNQKLCYTRSELAEAMGVSVNSIDKMVETGALPPAHRCPTVKFDVWLRDDVIDAIRAWGQRKQPVGADIAVCPAL